MMPPWQDRVFVIAEAGVNHNGDLESSRAELVDVAADAGCSAVKFQTLPRGGIGHAGCADGGLPAAEHGPGGDAVRDAQAAGAHARRAHFALRDHARARSILMFSTAFDLGSVDFLAAMDLPLWKVPSGEITNLPYLERIARQGKPVALSTGMATLAEVDDAVRLMEANGCPRARLCVLHCNTEYPTPFGDVNLRAMATMGQALGTAWGYSDHTQGIEIAAAAVALGARVIEKHFPPSTERCPGRTTWPAWNRPNSGPWWRRCATWKLALGDGIKKRPSPRRTAQPAGSRRKSIVAARAIAAGEVVHRGKPHHQASGHGAVAHAVARAAGGGGAPRLRTGRSHRGTAMIVAIHQPSYFPWLGLLHKIRNCDTFVVMDEVQLSDSAFQHRNLFLDNGGRPQYLSIPFVRKGYRELPLRELRIASGRLAPAALGFLRTNYARSPLRAHELLPKLQAFYAAAYESLFEVRPGFDGARVPRGSGWARASCGKAAWTTTVPCAGAHLLWPWRAPQAVRSTSPGRGRRPTWTRRISGPIANCAGTASAIRAIRRRMRASSSRACPAWTCCSTSAASAPAPSCARSAGREEDPRLELNPRGLRPDAWRVRRTARDARGSISACWWAAPICRGLSANTVDLIRADGLPIPGANRVPARRRFAAVAGEVRGNLPAIGMRRRGAVAARPDVAGRRPRRRAHGQHAGGLPEHPLRAFLRRGPRAGWPHRHRRAACDLQAGHGPRGGHGRTSPATARLGRAGASHLRGRQRGPGPVPRRTTGQLAPEEPCARCFHRTSGWGAMPC